MKYQLYPWQSDCLEIWRQNHCHGIINVVTGSGKTYLALAAAGQLIEKYGRDRLRIKIIVPTASLLTQWTSAILTFFDGAVTRRDIGIYYSGHKSAPEHLFMVYVINSARYSAARHVIKDINCGYTVFFIADECHRYIGGENSKIFDFLPAAEAAPRKYASLGLSATPGLEHPENASILIPALGPEIFRYGFKEAAENNTLCPYAAFHIALSFTGEEQAEYDDLSYQLSKAYSALVSRDPSLKTLHGARFFRALCQIAGDSGKYAHLARMYLNFSYKRKNITSDAQSRIGCVLKLISLLDRNDKIIIFGERIEQADLLYKKMDALYPNQAARYHSGLGAQARKLALERFQNGEIRILISCRALDEGFDVPSANVGIVMSSASVNRQRTQRLGRILRKYEGKEIASLYYLFVASSSEEQSYFPIKAQTAAVCELSYLMEEDQFIHPAYEERVWAVLKDFEKKNPDSSLLSEAAGCFEHGLVRPDWLFPEAFYAEKINSAKMTSERNYWICMKQLAGL